MSGNLSLSSPRNTDTLLTFLFTERYGYYNPVLSEEVKSASKDFLQHVQTLQDHRPILDSCKNMVLTKGDLEQVNTFLIANYTRILALAPLNISTIFSSIKDIRVRRNQPMTVQTAQEIINIWNNHTLRFSYKQNTEIPRTIDITFDHNKQLRAIIHTNKKIVKDGNELLDNTSPLTQPARTYKNCNANLGNGTHKKVKIGYNYGNKTGESIARMQINIASINDLFILLKEMQFAKRHRFSHFIDAPYLGSLYIKNNKLAAYVYSRKAMCTLRDLEQLGPNGKPIYLTQCQLEEIQHARHNKSLPALYLSLFNDVLNGLDEMHSTGEIHRDITAQNIFVYFNQDGKLSAKISDLGEAVMNYETALSQGSLFYAAPQVFHAHNSKENHLYSYYFAPSDEILPFGKVQYYNMKEFNNDEKFADPKDDIYAFGICIWSVFYGKAINLKNTPTNKQYLIKTLDEFTKLFSSTFGPMLAIKRQDRPTIKQLQTNLATENIAPPTNKRARLNSN